MLRTWLAAVSWHTVRASAISRLLRPRTNSPTTSCSRRLRAGPAIRAAGAAAIQQTQRTREAAEPLDRAPGLLVLEADGAMIQFTDGWHKVKIGMVTG